MGSCPAAPQPCTLAGCYSLSVRRTELTSWDSVTHYRIHRLENGWLYISPRLTFSNLHDLVDHYTGKGHQSPGQMSPTRALRGSRWAVAGPAPACGADVQECGHCTDATGPCPECGEGLCCALRQPCSMESVRAAPALAQPTVVKKPSLNWDKIDR